jgi:hypothetical protein
MEQPDRPQALLEKIRGIGDADTSFGRRSRD